MNFIRFASSVSVSFLLVGCGPPSDQPVLGSVFQVEGSGAVASKAAPLKPRPLTRDEKLSPGDEVRLERESVAVLCLTPGIYLRCLGETHIRIEQLSVAKDGDETGNAMYMRRAAIRLESGRVHVFLPSAGPSRASLKITSDRGTVSTKAGSLASIAFSADAQRVLCARGDLAWTEPSTLSMNIAAGYFLERRSDANAGAVPRLAADDPAAQGEIMALLDSAQAIADLETAARNSQAPWRRQ